MAKTPAVRCSRAVRKLSFALVYSGVTPRFKEALRWMAANRKAYHVVDEAELAKASGTEHHGGVCFLIKKRHGTSVAQWVAKAGEEDCVLALEDVGNPHNLRAIMRSCARTGVKGVVVQDAGVLESGAAIRTAEGGAEHVEPITGDSFIDTLDQFRKAELRDCLNVQP